MARPQKIGLDYFPLDVDFFEDEKILAISGEFAVKGEIIALRLLCEIYQNGYFVKWSELLKNKMARLGGLSAGLIEEVVIKLVKYGFFDESLFCEHKVLTSHGIQKRFFEAVKRRKDVNFSEFLLIDVVNVNINPSKSVVNDNISTQSKVDESKVDKSKVKKDVESAHFSTSSAQNILLSKQISIDQWAMMFKVPTKRIHECIYEFAQFKERHSENTWRTEADLTKNFEFWLRSNAQPKSVKPQINQNGNFQKAKRR